MNNKKRIFGIIIAVIVIGVGIALVNVISHTIKTDPQKARKFHSKMPVKTAGAKVQTIHAIIGASGQTQEFEKVTLTAKISQPVVSVKVNIGDLVKKNQLLIAFKQRLIKATVKEAQENVNKAKTNLEYRRLTYKRLNNIYTQNLIAKTEIETADEQIKQAQWEYSRALRQLEQSEQDLSYTRVVSPIKGIVLERPVNVGEIPKVDSPIITLGIIDDIYMTAKVPEDKISYVHVQQEADVLFESFPNEVFTGEVVKIDPHADPKTRTFNVFIKIPNSTLKLKPGLTGFARIKNYKTALAVPTVSVINPVGESATVFAIDQNAQAHIKHVKIGVSAGGLTEIIEGLQEGDNVITTGVQFLKDGDKVQIMED